MSKLKEAIISSDVPSGICSLVSNDVLERALLDAGLASNLNTAFLMCAHVQLRPERLPGEAKHILMDRDRNFYELTITWEMTHNAPVKTRYYNAAEVKLTPFSLGALLKAYAGVSFGSRKPKLIPQWILWSFRAAQEETTNVLHQQAMNARIAFLKLERSYNILQE